MRYLRGSFRFRLLLLVFLSIFPGILLTIYSVITKQRHVILEVPLVAIASLIAAWFGGNVLILRRVNALVELSKRLSSGDLAARSGPIDRFGFLGELAQAIDQMAGSLERQTAQLQQHADQVAALSEIAGEFAIFQDLPTLLQRVVEKAMKLLATSHASLALYDPLRGDLELMVMAGFPIPVGTRIRMGEGAAGRAAQTRQTVIIDDNHLWEGHLPEFEAYPFSTVMQVPIVYQGELIGVLGVAEIGSARNYNQAEIHLMTLFAGQAASAIKNARLFVETRRRLLELEAINEVSTALRVAKEIDEMLPVLLEKTMAIVNISMGCIWLYNPADKSLRQAISNGIPAFRVYLGPDQGIVGTVFSSGQPYFSFELSEDPTTPSSLRSQIPPGLGAAFIPIRTSQAIVGVLEIGFRAPRGLSDDESHLLTTIAEIAGNAIHRMKLHEETKNQLQRLSALHQIDLAITSSLDLENTLQVLLDQVITQLGVDAACILTFNPYEQTLEFAANRGFMTDALRNTDLHLGEGYAGQAALEQCTIYVPNLKTRNADTLRSPSLGVEGFVAYYAVPLVAKSQTKGVLEIFHRSPLERDTEWLDFLEALASQAAIAIDNASLFKDLQRSNIKLNLAYSSTIEGWSRALDLRDRETEGHSRRVTKLTLRLARAMSVNEADLVHIRRGALLHDIGKLGIPDRILLKPGPLTDEEKGIIQNHPTIGFELLAPIAYLRPALDIPYCHHEKWDGTGYPRRLKGEQIPLAARIFAVVDVWDALLSDRPYRKAWLEEKARAYLLDQAGGHFDPQMVDGFISILGDEENFDETDNIKRND